MWNSFKSPGPADPGIALPHGSSPASLNVPDCAACPDIPPRVAIFNVKYSPNLGDGVIAECLEHALRRCRPGLEVISVDLAGRGSFSQWSGRQRRAILGLMEGANPILRRRFVPLAISLVVRFRLKSGWEARLDGCDFAIIGGGALIADADQNFPIKLSTALALCTKRRIPVAIGHVGVSSRWSEPGRRRFARALKETRLVSLSFRDPASRDAWQEMFGGHGMPSPEVALDPGLLARETYGCRPVTRMTRRPLVGLCITNPMVLRLHGEGPHDSRYTREWFDGVVRGFVERGDEVVLFTNGSPEDETFKDAIYAGLENKVSVTVADRPSRPRDLALLIGGLDAVLAHRLHACIVAYSYGVPAVGLKWDAKLVRFFKLTERDDFVLSTGSASPDESVALIHAAMADPPDERVRQRISSECREGITRLAARIELARMNS